MGHNGSEIWSFESCLKNALTLDVVDGNLENGVASIEDVVDGNLENGVASSRCGRWQPREWCSLDRGRTIDIWRATSQNHRETSGTQGLEGECGGHAMPIVDTRARTSTSMPVIATRGRISRSMPNKAYAKGRNYHRRHR